jgi:hypothetical protein
VSGDAGGVARGAAEVAARGRNPGGTAGAGRGATGGSKPGGISGAGRAGVGWRPDRGGDRVKEDLTTSVAVAIWRAHNSNLILRRGRRSDVDGRQGDAILISDQVKQKDNNSRLKASRREPITGSQPLIPHALIQQRHRCGRCCGLRLRRWRISAAVA